MALIIEEKKNAYLHDTEVENLFIAEYMIDAPGDYVKVYLYSLMLAQHGVERSPASIAKALSLKEDDVHKAFSFFSEMGLVRIQGGDIIFESLKEKLYGGATGRGEDTEESDDIYDEIETEERKEAYNRLLNNEPIAEMTKEIQTTIGRFLNIREKEGIMALIQDLGVKPEVIAKAYSYADGKGTDNYKYVSKVVTSWAKHGIKDKEQVEEYLTEVDERFYVYKRVMKALGFKRYPTEEEKNIIDRWVDDMNYTMEDILGACAKTAGIGNPNINYVNAVLRNKKKKQEEGPSRSKVLAYYEKLRDEAKAQAERARLEVEAKVPEIARIEEELVEASKEMTMALVQGNVHKKENIEELKGRVSQLERKKDALLTENNIPVDYMEPRYRCRLCKDTGVQENGQQCSCYSQVAKEAASWQVQSE